MFCDHDRKRGGGAVAKQDEKSKLLKVWVCVCIGFCKGALQALPQLCSLGNHSGGR